MWLFFLNIPIFSISLSNISGSYFSSSLLVVGVSFRIRVILIILDSFVCMYILHKQIIHNWHLKSVIFCCCLIWHWKNHLSSFVLFSKLQHHKIEMRHYIVNGKLLYILLYNRNESNSISAVFLCNNLHYDTMIVVQGYIDCWLRWVCMCALCCQKDNVYMYMYTTTNIFSIPIYRFFYIHTYKGKQQQLHLTSDRHKWEESIWSLT